MFGLGLQELVLLIIIGIPIFFWGWALVDILKNEFTGSNKVVWLLLVILVPFCFILYFIIGTKQKLPKNDK
mgnify:CR=1 FL=1